MDGVLRSRIEGMRASLPPQDILLVRVPPASIQMATGAVVSGLVATLYDERSALSMTAVMAVCSLAALASYLLLARPAERVVTQE